jgi:hypothetical protein
MATVASIITSGRYDLRDPNKTLYEDEELLNYLNRGLNQLDRALASINSDWVHGTEEATDIALGDDYVVAPADLMSDRSVWIGSNRLVKRSVDYIYYKRKHISAQGKPDDYSLEGLNIIFEREADQLYDDFVIHYNKKSTALTLVGNMPFNDRFNDPLRQIMVLLAKNREETILMADSELYNFFLDSVMGEVVSRNYCPRRFRMDF